MTLRPRWLSALPFTALSVVVIVVFVVLIQRGRSVNEPYGAGTNDYIGRSAPDFTLPALDGTQTTLSALQGNVVVLDLWATWCPPCVEELPSNAQIAAKYADRGVKFFAVNLGDSPDTVKQFLADKKLNVPVLLDQETGLAATYGAQYIPLLVVIDSTGRIVAHDNVAPEQVGTILPKWIESALKSGQAS